MTSPSRQATSYRARLAGTALLTTCALAVTATTGCGLALRKGSQKALRVAAEAVLGDTASRFFDSVGQDRPGMRSQDGGRTSGDAPGLYAAVPDIPACDRARLTDLLTRDPAKAAAWARAVGITPTEIGPFLGRTTPVLLGSDTLVRNHRFENGTEVPYPALLQAGTAVLVDPWGQPVAKCGCGNPLTRLTPVPDKTEPQGMPAQWQDVYRSSSVVAVNPAGAQLTRFTLADATTPGRVILRPTGTGGEADTITVTPPPSRQPTTRQPTQQPTTGRPTPTRKPSDGPTARPTIPRTDGPTARPTTLRTDLRTTRPTTPPTDGPTTRPTTPPTRTAPTVIPTRPTTTPPTTTVGPTRPVTPPTLTLSTSSVAIGADYVARATGFAPGEAIRFTWTGPSNGTITTTTADNTGAVAITVREGAAPGDYRIHATGLASGRSAGAPLRVV